MRRWQLRLLIGSTMVAALSGLAYFYMKHFMASADPFSVINHPLQPWMLKVHVLSAPVVVFAIGAIAPDHILPHFRSGAPWGRRTGISTILITLLTVASGYLLQILTGEWVLSATAWIHLGAGLAFVGFIRLHRRSVRDAPPQAAESG